MQPKLLSICIDLSILGGDEAKMYRNNVEWHDMGVEMIKYTNAHQFRFLCAAKISTDWLTDWLTGNVFINIRPSHPNERNNERRNERQ